MVTLYVHVGVPRIEWLLCVFIGVLRIEWLLYIYPLEF
jgi:hypothetical protein